MNIGGLLTRSFGTGPSAINKAEADALTSMRDRQAFIDEEVARLRKAKIENVMSGISMPTGPVPIASAPAVMPGLTGAEALARVYGATAAATPSAGVAAPLPLPGVTPPAAPTAGVAPAAATTAGVSPPQIKGRTAGRPKSTAEQYYDKEILSTLNALADHMANKPLRISTKGEVPGAGPSIEYKAWDTKRQQLEDRVKSLEAGRISAAPAAAPTTARTGEQFKELNKINTQTPAAKVAAATKRTFATTSEEAIKNVLGREGGYANNPADRGGETKYGISKRSYPNLDIANLTREEAAAIYKKDYWDAMNIDQLPPEMREVVFDAAVNQGKDFASKALQQSGMDPAKFLALREQRYRDIVARDPSQAQFTGWFNRVNEFKGVTTKLGAAAPAASNEYFPPNMDASQAPVYIPRMEFKFRTKSAERKELERQALAFREQGLPDLYAEAVTQLRQIDNELIHMQGMVGLGDIVDNPRATQRLSQVMSYYLGGGEGYYKLQPRSDGKYNEIVNGKLARQGLTMQEVADSTRMIFDEAYAASVNAMRQKQGEAAIDLSKELQKIAADADFQIQKQLLVNQSAAFIQGLKDTAEYKRAMDVARATNQGKAPEPKFFNAVGGGGEQVTLMSVGNNIFQVTAPTDAQGNQVAGPLSLTPLTGLMPPQ